MDEQNKIEQLEAENRRLKEELNSLKSNSANNEEDTICEKFKDILKSGEIGLWEYYIGEHIVFDDSISSFLGYSTDDFDNGIIPEKIWIDSIHPNDLHYIKKQIKGIVKKKYQHYSTTYRIRNASGKWVWLKSTGVVSKTKKNGEVESIRGVTFVIEQAKSLQEEHLLYVNAVENSNNLIAVLDKNFKYKLVNQTYMDYHGVEKNEILKKRHPDILGEEVFNKISKPKFEKCLNGETIVFEAEYNFKPKGLRKGIVTYSPLYKNGEIEGIVINIKDLTEFFEIRDEARIKDEHIKAMTKAAHQTVMLFDRDLKILDISGAENFGITNEFCLDKKLEEIVEPEAARKSNKKIIETFKTGESYNFENNILWNDKKYYFVISTYPVNVENDEVRSVGVMVSDITDLKLAEQAVRKSEEMFGIIAENISDMFILHKPDGSFDYISPAVEKITGYTAEEYIKFGVYENVYPDDIHIIERALKEILEGKDNPTSENRIFTKDRDIKWIETKTNVLRDKDGNIEYFVSSTTDITERKKAELDLRESEERFKAFMDNIPGAAFIKDKDYKLIYCNKKYAAMTGKTPEELINSNTLDDVPEELIAQYREENEKVFNQNQIIIAESFYEFQGELSHWLTYKFPIIIINDILMGAVSIDITDRKKAELALKESEKNLSIILENIPLGVFAHNLDGNIRLVNKTSEEYTGYSREELMNMTVGDIDEGSITRNDREVIWLYLNKHGGYKRFRAEHIRKDGSKYPIEISITSVTFNNEKVILGLVQDITDRIKAEKEIKESEMFLESIFEGTSNSIFVIDVKRDNFYYNRFNKVAEQHTGLKSKDIIGKTSFDVFDKETAEKMHQQYRRCLKTGEQIYYEEYVEVLGKEYWFLTSLNPLKDENGMIYRIVGTATDITERKMAEEKLAELNASKDKFFDIIAHDLTSPFSGFIGLTQSLIEDFEYMTLNDLQEIANSVNESAQNLFMLIRNLLEWSTTQTGRIKLQKEIFLLNDVIEDKENLFKLNLNQKKIEFTKDLDAMLTINADKKMISTIIGNIISNAIKFTKLRGHINIKTEKTEDGVSIIISDNGTGMDKDKVNNLFKIDKSTKSKGTSGEQGTGLGLILSKEFVDLHGGSIYIESEVDNGTVVKITIPE